MGQGKGDGNPNAINEHGFQEGVRNQPQMNVRGAPSSGKYGRSFRRTCEL